MSYSGYTPAFDSHTTKGSHSQKFEFDTANHIAKQQLSQQTGGQVFNAPPPPPLPQRPLTSSSNQLNLRTRDWSGQPWSGESNIASSFPVRSTSPWRKQSTISSANASHSAQSPALLGIYDPTLLSAQTQSSSSSILTDTPQGISSQGSGLPTSNYQPSSTIPMFSGGYKLPSSPLAQSNVSAPFTESWNQGQSSIPTPPPLPTWNTQSSSNIPLRTRNWGTTPSQSSGWNQGQSSISNTPQTWSQGQSTIPTPPPLPTWNNQSSASIPLRTRNWGSPSASGWSNFQPSSNFNSIGQSGWNQGQSTISNTPQTWKSNPTYSGSIPLNKGFNAPLAQNNIGQAGWNQGQSTIPTPPPLPNFQRNATTSSNSLSNRSLRTREWSSLGEQGWFPSQWYKNESILPFNTNRTQNPLNDFTAPVLANTPPSTIGAPITSNAQNNTSLGQNNASFNNINNSSSFAPTSSYYAPTTTFTPASSYATTSSVAPITNNTGAPLTGRKGRKAARQQARMLAIDQKLHGLSLNPPIGDPAVNHYRRGAKSTVPLVGPANTAPATGSLVSRRRGRRNNVARRSRGRFVPVTATQAPIAPVAPVSAYPAATYRTLYSNNGSVYPSSQFAVQPNSFTTVSSSSAGIPLTQSSNYYTTAAPIQNTYSAPQMVKIAPAQVLRPTGGAAF